MHLLIKLEYVVETNMNNMFLKAIELEKGKTKKNNKY